MMSETLKFSMTMAPNGSPVCPKRCRRADRARLRRRAPARAGQRVRPAAATKDFRDIVD